MVAPAAAAAAAAAAVGTAPTGRGAKARPPAKGAPVAPSVSEQAVHVNDRASAVFVIVVVAVFALIFVNALFLGHKGLFSGLLPHSTPVASEPVPASGEPSASASAVASGGLLRALALGRPVGPRVAVGPPSSSAAPSPSAAAPSPSPAAS